MVDGSLPQGRRGPRDGSGHAVRRRGAGLLLAGHAARQTPGRGGGGIHRHRPQGRLAAACRRHADAGQGGRRAAAGLQGREADGVLGAVSDRLRPVPGAARCAREAEAERRRPVLRARGRRRRWASAFAAAFWACLHMDIVRERLEREYDLDLLVTAPNVAYRVQDANGTGTRFTTRPRCRPAARCWRTEEPYVRASIIVPKEFVGTMMDLNQDRRGDFRHMEYLWEERVQLVYDLPLAEVVLDYYDQLKSRTPRLRVVRLRPARVPGGEPCQGRRAAGGRAGRLAVADHPPGQRLQAGQAAGRSAARADPQPDVRGRRSRQRSAPG